MGSLTSRPKVPAISASPIVSTPQPISLPSSSPSVSTDVSTPAVVQETAAVSTDTTASDTGIFSGDVLRVENLLRRNRGVGGTILTGFRGLLSANELTPQRKTLLGE